jgi:predicted GIY-YIG superfamily endonuclease
MSFAVYAISGKNGRVYVGQSQDVELRLQAHNKGLVASTKADRPWTLFKAAEFDTREQARFFEWQLKRSRGKRLKWLKSK